MKYISTTRKKAFLRSEFNAMQFSDYKEFIEVMECDTRKCVKCGTYYWNGCLKRCTCV